MEKKYCFLGNGIDAQKSFDDVFDSEEEVIKSAKYEFDNKIDEHLGYLSEDENDESLNPIIDVCKVEEFNIEHAVKLGIETLKDVVAEQYFDFESDIDDGDVRFEKGFNDEMLKVIMPIMDKYFMPLGCTQKCYSLYQVDVRTGEKVKTE